jgi:hypothetical protein
MVMATHPFPQERDVSTTPETSNPLSNPRTGDGRFARGNPGGPGRPRGAVRDAASALDQLAAEASTALINLVLELARAGHFRGAEEGEDAHLPAAPQDQERGPREATPLRCPLADFHSVRVNRQWRLIFRWNGGRGEASGIYLDDHSYR